jgi:glycosyltransferase involved in cell wall biosynthesis
VVTTSAPERLNLRTLRYYVMNKTLPSQSILIVQQYAIPPDQPGGTRHFEFAKFLIACGWQTEIFCSDYNHVNRRYFRRRDKSDRHTKNVVEEGVTFRYFWVPGYERNDARRAYSMAVFSIRIFWSTLRSNSNIVYASSPHIFGAFAAKLAASLRRKRFVFEVRDLWPELIFDSTKTKQGIQYSLLGSIASYLYAHSDLIVIFAGGSRSVVEERGAEANKITVLSGIEPSKISPFDRKTKRSSSEFRLVFMGTHGKMYGLETLLEAAHLLQNRGEDTISVHLIGDGPEKTFLQEMSGQLGLRNTVFHDPVPKSRVLATLQEFDVGLNLVRPSHVSGFGISPQKLYDYMALGLPVISNVLGENETMIRCANAGITSRADDPESLAMCILEMKQILHSDPNAFNGGPKYLLEFENRSLMLEEVESRLQGILDRY